MQTQNLAALFLVLACFSAAAPPSRAAEPAGRLKTEQLDGRIRVTVANEPFAEYVYQGYAKPIVYPIFGPGRIAMTRNFPIRKDVPGEPTDHPHHKSLWLSHGNVNGEDFWLEKGKIVHQRIQSVDTNPRRIVITADNRWVNRQGKTVCTDTTRVGFLELANGARAIDYDITIHASHGPVTFGDTKEGFMAVRTHPALQLTGDPKRGVTAANGQAINSRGVKDKAMWGQQAEWVDYSGKIDGRLMGLAMFDHPGNPRHPTFWHARDYGLVAANPFGVSDFTKQKERSGALTLAAGQDLRFRYRIVLHRGDAKEAGIAKLYEEYGK